MSARKSSLPERTTPESYELQKLLRQMADAGCTHVVMEVSSHALRGLTGVYGFRSRPHLHQPDPGPSGFSRTMEDYPPPRRCCSASAALAALNLDDDPGGADSGTRLPGFTYSGRNGGRPGGRGRLEPAFPSGVDLTPGRRNRCPVSVSIPGGSPCTTPWVRGLLLTWACRCRTSSEALAKVPGVKGRMRSSPSRERATPSSSTMPTRRTPWRRSCTPVRA